jgi:carboxyl-terminal processing protease
MRRRALSRLQRLQQSSALDFCVLFSILFSSCSSPRISRSQAPTIALPPPTRAASATLPAGTPLAPGSALIAQGYRDLLDQLVLSVEPSDLLNAALSGAAAESRREGARLQTPSIPSGLDSGAALQSFQPAYAALLQAGGKRLDSSSVAQAALVAMAEQVHDCHTAYLTKGQWDSVQADLDGENAVASLPLTFQLQPPYLVTSVVAGSDADKQGVHAGDRILAFDGASLDQTPLSQRKFLDAGAPGSTATLALQTPNGSRRDVKLQRAEEQRPVITTHLYGAVGYIQLRTFTVDLNIQIDRALSTLRGQGAKGFVLDLRGNLGGELDTDVYLLSHFIGSGLLATVGRPGQTPDQVRAEGSLLPGPPPLAVLVDGGSLSASELFAEDIQQYHAGTLVGTMTPGCLLASTFAPLSDGSAMQVSADTVDVGPQHVVVNNAGVKPDDPVSISASDLAAGRDPQLDRALAVVRGQIR